MKKFAQEAPPAPGGAPPSGGEAPSMPPPPGGGGMGAPMGGGPGGPPGPEGAPGVQSTFNIIHSPLDSLGKILADVNITSFAKNKFDQTPSESAKEIWLMYGGSPDGRTSIHKGERVDLPDPSQPDPNADQEYNNTKHARWKRLPKGVGIDEITSQEAIELTLTDGYFDLSVQQHKQQPSAKSVVDLIKLAIAAEKNKKYKLADKIDSFLLNVYSPK